MSAAVSALTTVVITNSNIESFSIPSWLFVLLFLLFTFSAFSVIFRIIKNKGDNQK